MTEAEWLACIDPKPMVVFLGDRFSEAKRRHFCWACGRRWCYIWDDRPDKAAIDQLCQRVLDEAEVEGNLAHGDSLADKFWELTHDLVVPIGMYWDMTAALTGNSRHWLNKYPDMARSAKDEASMDATELYRGYQYRTFLADVLRDVIGTPFRPCQIQTDWLRWNGGAVPSLAQAIDPSRAFDRLPILADALEDAGCTDAAILDHCRGPGPHVRGCWVVDLILGKS